MILENDFRLCYQLAIATIIKANNEILELNYKGNITNNGNITELNQIDTKIYLLKMEVTEGIQNNSIMLHDVSKKLDQLPFTAEVSNLYNELISVLLEHDISLNSLSYVGYLEQFPPFTFRESKQRYKRKIIKLLNKSKRANKRTFKRCMKLNRKIERLNKKLKKQDKMVLNCNTWLSGICENEFSKMVHDPINAEEKKIIEEKIINKI